jgi:hypothetical protein
MANTYATLNPSDQAGVSAFSNGNLTIDSGQSRATIAKSSGKHYFEVTLNSADMLTHVGVTTSAASIYLECGNTAYGFSAKFSSGVTQYVHNSSAIGYPADHPAAYSQYDVWMVAIDITTGKMWFGLNGTWNGSGDPAAGTGAVFSDAGLQGTMLPMVYTSAESWQGKTITANFGASAFAYTVPSGFNSGWYNPPPEVHDVSFSETINIIGDEQLISLIYEYSESSSIYDEFVLFPFDYEEIESSALYDDFVLFPFDYQYLESTLIYDDFFCEVMVPVSTEYSSLSVVSDNFESMIFSFQEGSNLFLPSLQISATIEINELGDGMLFLPELSISATGDAGIIGILSVSLPQYSFSAEGIVNPVAIGSISIPIASLFAEAMVGVEGIGLISLPMLSILSSTSLGEVGVGTISIPAYKISAISYLGAEGNASIELPMFGLFARISPSEYTSLVLNLKNQALSLYSNYNFNSMCQFNGVPLGATGAGIFDLNSGTLDDGHEIDWSFRTAYLDLDYKASKRLRQAWLSCKTDGDMVVTVVQPDGTQYEYTAVPIDITEDGIRVKFGKGIGSKYVALDFRNTSGNSIVMDTIRIHFDILDDKR